MHHVISILILYLTLFSNVFCAASDESLEDSEAVKSIEVCARALEDRYDEVFGGFGEAPKFPRPAELNLLLTQHLRAKAAGDASFAGKALVLRVLAFM